MNIQLDLDSALTEMAVKIANLEKELVIEKAKVKALCEELEGKQEGEAPTAE